jgi:hypothetical protein
MNDYEIWSFLQYVPFLTIVKNAVWVQAPDFCTKNFSIFSSSLFPLEMILLPYSRFAP